MTKRTARAQRTQAKNGAGPAPLHLVEPMLAGMTTTRQHLLAWVHAHGLAALDELFREEAVALAGPKGRHQRPRTHHHWGTAATELTFGGPRVQVRRPRVRPTIGGEATLPSVAAFRDRDPLTARMMQQLLAGVSMRDYEGSLEARPSGCQRPPYIEPPGSGKLSHPGSPIVSQAGSPILSHPGSAIGSHHPVDRDRIPSSFSPPPEIFWRAHQLQEVTSGGTEESGDRHP